MKRSVLLLALSVLFETLVLGNALMGRGFEVYATTCDHGAGGGKGGLLHRGPGRGGLLHRKLCGLCRGGGLGGGAPVDDGQYVMVQPQAQVVQVPVAPVAPQMVIAQPQPQIHIQPQVQPQRIVVPVKLAVNVDGPVTTPVGYGPQAAHPRPLFHKRPSIRFRFAARRPCHGPLRSVPVPVPYPAGNGHGHPTYKLEGTLTPHPSKPQVQQPVQAAPVYGPTVIYQEQPVQRTISHPKFNLVCREESAQRPVASSPAVVVQEEPAQRPVASEQTVILEETPEQRPVYVQTATAVQPNRQQSVLYVEEEDQSSDTNNGGRLQFCDCNVPVKRK